MTSNMTHRSLLDSLSGKRLIVVSNREPYVHKRSGPRSTVEIPVGGLTSALDEVLKATQGTWVAWGSGNADKDEVDKDNRVRVPPEDPVYTLKRVWLKPQEVDNYYHGYANQVLWPLCHITLDRVYYRKNFWYYYESVNRAFAEAVLEEADKESIVWFHDYHLCLAPRYLRERSPLLTLFHFWHIPWPDWSVFRICPQSREILEGLLANDLIGFQIPLYARNFMDCVRECLDADIDYQQRTVKYEGHTTRLEALPISVDFEKFTALASSAKMEKIMAGIRSQYRLQNVLVGIGVDRLEYTKALIKRLQAIELFFERYASFRRKFTFIQVAIPTRLREPYLSYGKSVEALIERINRRFGQENWKPVISVTGKIDHKDLAAYYRMADLAIISSVNDGMNLVAKEYVSCQVDRKGVLILSELAGAAEELEGSLMVNPYDIEAFSDRIKQGLVMRAEEKSARMISLRRQVKERDITRWIADVLAIASSLQEIKQKKCLYLFDHQDEIRQQLGNRELILFLDFDGTLAPIVSSPDKAAIPHATMLGLERIAMLAPLGIISGRSLVDLQEHVDIKGITYAGNHGAEIGIDDNVILAPGADKAANSLRSLLEILQTALSHIYGAMVEDKGITASVHYRLVDEAREGDVLRIFWDIARDHSKEFRITTGKKVLEIRPHAAWNKGQAVARIMELKGGGMMPIYVGDDTTDEDAFLAIKGSGLSISIGQNSKSDYYLRDQEEISVFLDWITGVMSQRTNKVNETAELPFPTAEI
jgi:trehalose 6-phosphate synthase/phosphatase